MTTGITSNGSITQAELIRIGTWDTVTLTMVCCNLCQQSFSGLIKAVKTVNSTHNAHTYTHNAHTQNADTNHQVSASKGADNARQTREVHGERSRRSGA